MTQSPDLLAKLEKMNVHKCEKCPKAFRSSSDLIKHQSYHEYFLSHLVSAYVSVERANIFKCDKCTRGFIHNRGLKRHKLKHKQETVTIKRKGIKLQSGDIPKPYKCRDCDVSYAAQSTLNAHSVLHLPFPHICECGIGYYKNQDLKDHIKLVHGTKNEEEDIVPPKEKKVMPQEKPKVIPPRKSKSKKGPTVKETEKKETIKKKFKVHLKTKVYNTIKTMSELAIPAPNVVFRRTSDNKLECPECKKLFAHRRSIILHYRVHSGERPHTCHLCPKAFSQGITLKRHIERHLAKEKIYACRHCPKAFNLPLYRDRHEATHSAVKPYECPFCGKAFHDESAMGRHKRIHTGERRYLCPYCPKAFIDLSGLIAHKLRHENRKRFACQICSKSFYDQRGIDSHMRVHTVEKTVVCDYCKKWFGSKYSLSKHIKAMHLIIKKTFRCDLCNKKFWKKSYLCRHIQVVHNKEKIVRPRRLECRICFEYFDSRESLQEHSMKEHEGLRCDKCSRYFHSPAHYKAHFLLETVQCELCDMKFVCGDMRERHFTKVHCPKRVKKIRKKSSRLNEI